jgi:hypothetical protein
VLVLPFSTTGSLKKKLNFTIKDVHPFLTSSPSEEVKEAFDITMANTRDNPIATAQSAV